MPYKVFFSYQSDHNEYCKQPIENALNKAISEIKEYKVVLDFGMRDTAGNPPLLEEMLNKAEDADIFIADLTSIASTDNRKVIPNPNVLLETGHSWKTHGHQGTIFVMNIAFGNPEDLPVDLKGLRHPITYNLNSGNNGNRNNEIKGLKNAFKKAITTAINSLNISEKTRWNPFTNLYGWPKSDFNGEFIEIEDYVEFENSIHNILTSKKNNVRIIGSPKCGKSRFLFEYLSSNKVEPDLKNKILYFDCSLSGGRLEPIIPVMQNIRNYHKPKVIILDNLNPNLHKTFYSSLEGSGIRLISLGNNTEIKESDIEIIKWDNELTAKLINKIVDGSYSHLGLQYFKVIEECGLNLEEVFRFLENYNESSSSYADSNLIEFYSLKAEPEIVSLLKALSLFTYVGIDETEQNQTVQIIRFFKLENIQLIAQLAKLKRRGLVIQKGDYIQITPLKLARELAVEFWNEDFIGSHPEFIDFIKTNSIVKPFIKRTKELLDTGKPFEFVVNISNTTLRKYDFLNTDEGSMLFMEFAGIAPNETFESLEVAFHKKTTEELVKFKEGRRYTVWALEKLVFRKDLFKRAANILYRLAIAENEDISNNSTGSFVQLFQVMLPGTEASLEERYNFLMEIAKDGLNDIIKRVFKLALKTGYFTRDAGAESQYDQKLTDYHPNYNEALKYQKQIAELIISIWEKTNDNSLKQILGDSILGFYLEHKQEIIIPFIKKLLQKEILTNELFKELVIIRNRFGNNVTEKCKIEYDTLLTKEMSPIESKLRTTVVFPTYKEVKKGEGEYDQRLDLLVDEIVRDNGFEWLKYLNILLEGTQYNTILFGRKLAEKEIDIDKIVDASITQLLKIPSEKQNSNFIGGIITGKDSIKFAKKTISNFTKHEKIIKNIFELSAYYSLDFEDFKSLVKFARTYNIEVTKLQNLSPLNLSIEDFEKLCMLLMEISDYENQFVCMEYISLQIEKENISIEKLDSLLYKITEKNPWLHNGNFWYFGNLESIYLNWLKHNSLNSFVCERIITQLLEAIDSYNFQHESEVARIFEFLIENHFDVLFKKIGQTLLSDKNYNINRNLISICRTYSKWSSEKVIKWCKDTGDEAALFFIKTIPFGKKGTPKPEWNSLFLDLMNTFYDIPYLLDSISSNLHSYSTVGTATPIYKYRIELVKQLVSSPIEDIRVWAKKEEQYLTSSMKIEKRHNENYGLLYY